MEIKLTKILIVLFSVFSFHLHAQYHPTISKSKEWLVKTCEFGNCLYDYYYFASDTVLNNRTYKVLDGYHYNKNFFLRENIQTKQVFLLIDDGSPVLEETLLYDYSLKIGDSIYLKNPVSPVSFIQGYFHLDSIVLKTFEQTSRKVFYLHGTDNQSNYHETKWIEGIGSTGLINTPSVMGDTTSMGVLLCVSENVKKIYSRKPNDTCYSNPVLSLPEQHSFNDIDFHYAQYSQLLILDTPIKKGGLRIFSSNGSEILYKKLSAETRSVDLSQLAPGVYFVRLEMGNQVFTKKILVDQY